MYASRWIGGSRKKHIHIRTFYRYIYQLRTAKGHAPNCSIY